ncbi:hypothetical protein [Novipirellula caenicola]|uniref:Uncharacterized protein n=1 Tax=Novipirellula caenicola TaxID=1536901 RepID=A0ABP9VQF9_9BACT
MSNPFQTSVQYDDYVGRIAIDEYRDAGSSSDLLAVAAKAASVPKGMMPVALRINGANSVKGNDVSISVLAVDRETCEHMLKAGESIPYRSFDGTLAIADLIDCMKRFSATVFPKRFEDAEFHSAD